MTNDDADHETKAEARNGGVEGNETTRWPTLDGAMDDRRDDSQNV